jgi:hypothetical protein
MSETDYGPLEDVETERPPLERDVGDLDSELKGEDYDA